MTGMRLTPRHLSIVAVAVALVLAGLPPPAALAQNFSPYFKTTGEGALDLYNDAVLCSVVLERELEAMTDSEERRHLEKGVNYARSFALFHLGSGNVVDVTGAILTPDNLPIDLRNARFDWQVKLLSLEDEGETPEAEIARCLVIYGHDWD